MADNIFKRLLCGRNRGKEIKRIDTISVTKDGSSDINECYNTIKDNILFMSGEDKPQVIQMESSIAGEGKTTMCCNLATSLSFNDKKVLIIDLDFRRPRVNKFFKVTNENGLVDYMSDKVSLDDAIKKTSYENLDILPRGSSIYNPSLLLTSEKFALLINELRETYDYIFLDSPPVLQVSEYIHVSKVADGILFIVAYGKVKKRELKDSSALLRKTGGKIIGTIMTFYDLKKGGYYGNKYYYYGQQK